MSLLRFKETRCNLTTGTITLKLFTYYDGNLQLQSHLNNMYPNHAQDGKLTIPVTKHLTLEKPKQPKNKK